MSPGNVGGEMEPESAAMGCTVTAASCRLPLSVTVSTHSKDGAPPVASTLVVALTPPVVKPKSDAATPVTGAPNVAVNRITLSWVVPSRATCEE